ncbi:16S rRNA (uracil(1498)-N(3))-methyltransferase [Staphylococcus agnetis]|uniref:16S rRNA (uracil(1498)-N(3))-methyltransferase n=1 Tax=Staphylococcus agnetis TaxID=985762 RepID=UPI0021D14352|nr:16S rRNA (uracil(1498)-N(3))-methyltransferase [Staphylococcus agnetis]UXU58453.1 16S rRNA (uracil(1498)-N(3))-methyltransferase [Staphylococcus agnetis]UXU60778.1 16S rRNA (uracil(1498)-N(3))-methyltransferase [Staphylococcus agnetis]
MQRYFLNENAELHQRFFITNSEDIHHILNVMRMDVGDTIIINFNQQRTYESQLITLQKDCIEIETSREIDLNTEMPVNVTICSGLIKSDKYEWLLQKATELGAHHFIATQMDRSVVKLNVQKADKKVVRWQKIVKEAAEQSYRQIVPKVEFISNFKIIYDMINQYDYVLMAYEESAKSGERSLLKNCIQNFAPDAKILLLFGPEGGFSQDEVAALHNKVKCVGLGPRILRAETAPLYALSAISYQLELK